MKTVPNRTEGCSTSRCTREATATLRRPASAARLRGRRVLNCPQVVVRVALSHGWCLESLINVSNTLTLWPNNPPCQNLSYRGPSAYRTPFMHQFERSTRYTIKWKDPSPKQPAQNTNICWPCRTCVSLSFQFAFILTSVRLRTSPFFCRLLAFHFLWNRERKRKNNVFDT